MGAVAAVVAAGLVFWLAWRALARLVKWLAGPKVRAGICLALAVVLAALVLGGTTHRRHGELGGASARAAAARILTRRGFHDCYRQIFGSAWSCLTRGGVAVNVRP